MELSYETQGTNTYLVYAVPQDVQLDMVSVGMLANNHIPGLAQTAFTQIDNIRYVKYNVSAKVSTDQLFMSPISKQRFLGVINGIVSAMLSAEEYMLDPGSILLDLSRMYSDVTTGETVLICVPSEECEAQSENVKDFIKKIMYDTSFDQNENCDYITKIINYLNRSAALPLPDFQEFLRSLLREKKPSAPPVSRSPKPQRSEINVQKADNVQPPVQPAEPIRQQPVQQLEVPPVEPLAPEAAADTGEKPMSLIYLLRHYSKENAAIYKAQQEKGAKKDSNRKAAPASKRAQKGKEKQIPVGFAVPGVEEKAPLSAVESPAPSAPAAAPAPPPATAPVSKPVELFGITDPGSMDFDKTVILGMEQNVRQVVMPYLVRRKNNERIPVDKMIFRLGRDVDFNDYAIIDNHYVGHSHCHLLQQDGEYFILDDNSKNHTKVNGTIIPPGQPVKIAHDYVISVADEEFEFKLY